MECTVIGISGKAHNGKTTVANIITRYLNTKQSKKVPMKIHISPFADKLKAIARDLFDWNEDKGLYYDALGNLIPDKGRQLLIEIGFYMRKIRPTVWLDYNIGNIKRTIESYEGLPGKAFFLIDDVRYLNELEALVDLGVNFRAIRVERASVKQVDDPSETQLDEGISWHKVFQNNLTQEELEKEVIKWVDQNLGL